MTNAFQKLHVYSKSLYTMDLDQCDFKKQPRFAQYQFLAFSNHLHKLGITIYSGSGSFNSMDSNSMNSLKSGQNFGQKFFNVLVKQCDFLQQLKFWLLLGQILNYQTSNFPILQKPNGYLRTYCSCSCTCVVRFCIGQCIFGYFSTLFEDLLQKSFLI